MKLTRLLKDKKFHRAFTLVLLIALTMSASASWTCRTAKWKAAFPPTSRSSAQRHETSCHPHQGPAVGSRRAVSYQTHAYELAAKIPTVLHQQPCYCYCDRMGHNSLHSCYENTHGARCATCLKELYYSYQQHKKARPPAQIRAGIIKGEWKRSTCNRRPR